MNEQKWEAKHGNLPQSNKQPSPWTFCKTGKKQELNLVHSDGYHLHDPKNIDAEARQFLIRFDPLKIEWLLIYGVGLGYYYKALESWLHSDPKRRVVFAEDDPDVLKAFLSTEIAGKLLDDPQADVIFYDPVNFNIEEFDGLIQAFLFHPDFVGSLDSYHTNKREDFERFKMLFEFYIHAQEAVTAEYLKKGSEFLNSFYNNVLHLDESYNGTAFFDQFKGIPAIICSAGPSLQKNIELLKTLKNKAVIIAGGTAMNALNGFECVPHFGCGVDPFSFHYSRIISNTAFETPFFYRSRMNKEAVRAVHGPKLYLPGATGYPIAEHIDEQLGYSSLELEEGANVINLSLAIAKSLGCNPLIIVGLDLAYTDGMSYSPSLKTHAIYDVREQFITKLPYEELLLVHDIYGQPVYSLMKWMIESNWYSTFAKNNPDIKLLNCTEGGIGFQGGETMSLREAADKYLTKTYDFDALIASILSSQAAAKAPSLERIKEALNKHSDSLKNCKALLQDFYARHSDLWKEKIPSPSPDLQELEEKLAQESAYTQFLQVFDEFYLRFMKSGGGSDQKTSFVKEMMSGRLSYLSELVDENLLMIAAALKQRADYDEALKPAQVSAKNGHALFEKTYENGLEEGAHRFYYPSGTLKSVINYSKGHLNGQVLLYFSNGTLYRSSTYEMGKREGKDQIYYPNGKLKLEGEYREDLPVGTAKSWYEDGRLEKEVVYFTPGEVVQVNHWDSSGNLIPSSKVPVNYIDNVTKNSLQLQNAFTGVSAHLGTLLHAMHGSLSPEVSNELEKELENLKDQLHQMQEIGEKLEQASGKGQQRKEFIWNTPTNQQAIYDYLQSFTSPMQESLLKLQWKLKNLLKPPEK